MNILNDLLLEWGLPTAAIEPTVFVANIVFVVVIAFLANFITKQGIIRVIDALIDRSRVKVLFLLKKHRVLLKFSHIAPAIVFYRLTPVLFAEWPTFIEAVRVAVHVYLIVVTYLVIDAILKVFLSAFAEVERTRDLPLKGLVQAVKLVVIILGTILAAAVVLGKSPMILMSGLGALTAVFLLVFKDAILGFVAGIQLSANNMIQIGDWIEMPKQNADGDVIDVSLTTVKVQNWDKTITTIPSYLLISDSFRNWRGMSESGGRRVKRAINIDVRSIRFLDEELLKRCESIHLLRPYLDRVLAEIQEHNNEAKLDTGDLINGRHLTNIGTFRAYCAAYIRQHKKVHQEMTQIVRQLAPGEHGLPLEIYLFTKTTAWVAYEGIQSDIFDHLIAILPFFDLRVFQEPSGADITELGNALAGRSDTVNFLLAAGRSDSSN